MFIKYDYTADGKPIMVEVTEEVAEFLREDKRLTENANRKERYRGTWVRYDEAVKAAEKYLYSGVGFVIPEGWFFLDIDHKELSDTLVQEILSRFDTYAEYSQSGAGLHLYGKCDFSRLPTETIDGKRKLDQFTQKTAPVTGIIHCPWRRSSSFILRVSVKQCCFAKELLSL